MKTNPIRLPDLLVRSLRFLVISLFVVGIAGSLHASIPVSTRFEPTNSGLHLYEGTTLANDTVMQSFAFDNTNHFIYVVQVTETGANGSSKTYAEHERDGDLAVTKLNFDGTTTGQTMYLEGFGHGVGIGVEPSGTTAYLWAEVDPVPDANAVGHGTRIARFKFANGTTRKNTDAISADFKKFAAPANASTTDPQVSCVLSNTSTWIAVRFLHSNGSRHIALYDLASVKAAPLPAALPATSAELKVPTAPIAGTFQGYTIYGSYLYLLYGDSYDVVPSPGNTELYCYDWNDPTPDSPTLVEEAGTTVFGYLTYREPEGMGIQKITSGGTTIYRLCFGFASGASGARKSNVAYKTGWAP